MVTLTSIRLLLVGLVLSVTGPALASLSLGDANFLGIIDPSEPANAGNQVEWINLLKAVSPGATGTAPGGPPGPPGPRDLDRTLSSLAGPLAEAVEVGAFRQNNGTINVFLPSPFQYVAGKYGTSLAVWYFAGGIAGDIVMPASAPAGGLSHTSAYNVVPEVSSLLVWTGMGLAGLCFFRRRLRG